MSLGRHLAPQVVLDSNGPRAMLTIQGRARMDTTEAVRMQRKP